MKLTETEWLIMNALWSGHPATAREIAERIPDGERWAHTTVKTMLARLAAKDVVSERKRDNTSVYEPRLSRRAAQRSALRTVFDRVLDGALEPLAHFLVEDRRLSASERRRLVEMLDAMETEEGKHDDRIANLAADRWWDWMAAMLWQSSLLIVIVAAIDRPDTARSPTGSTSGWSASPRASGSSSSPRWCSLRTRCPRPSMGSSGRSCSCPPTTSTISRSSRASTFSTSSPI